MSGDAALGAHPELHARLYPTAPTVDPAGGHPGGRVYYAFVCRATLGAYARTATFVRNGATSLDGAAGLKNGVGSVFPPDGYGGLNTKELGPIPSISPPAPHHGLVVENRALIRFREILVFHGEYAYPEYLLAYRRR